MHFSRRKVHGRVSGMPIKTANAVWKGSLAEGTGHLKTQSGKLDTDYSWKSRAEDGPLTNPEELLAAAHAGCYSMAFSHILGTAGKVATSIETSAAVSFEKQGDGFAITKIVLKMSAVIPGIGEDEFQTIAHMAKVGCPVSKALSSVPIELVAALGK